MLVFSTGGRLVTQVHSLERASGKTPSLPFHDPPYPEELVPSLPSEHFARGNLAGGQEIAIKNHKLPIILSPVAIGDDYDLCNS